MIVSEGLTKYFGPVKAIEDFTVSIPDGVIFGLLGPNGAGKTTTMRMLAGLIKPSQGKAVIDNMQLGDEKNNTPIRKLIGLLPEVPGLYETLGAYKNLDYYAQLYGVAKIKRETAIKEILTNLGLWERRNDPVGGFSKGMKQKIAIARAFIHNPKYIFLDEPTASLDPEASKLVRDYILELKSQGRTILLNTHNLAEAERVCDTVALVKNRIIKIGNPKELARNLFARTIRITVSKIPENIFTEIASVADISNVKVQGNILVLSVKNPEKDNPNILSWLMKKGIQVVYISEEEYSLEDVYLKLIKEGT